MANLTDYRHVPLPPGDEYIRLMSLEPGQKGSVLRCSLRAIKVRDAKTFEALSYACGDVDLQHRIICDGRPLKISTNLNAALHNLRFNERPRSLWLDAVCVDQGKSESSVREMQSQIQLFCKIYDASTRCIVFIGEPDKSLDEATQKLFATSASWGTAANIAMGLNGIVGAAVGGTKSLALGSYVEQKLLRSTMTPERKQALEDLFARSWFHRLWTYQEVLLSSDVVLQCGQYTVDWEKIKLLIPALQMAANGQSRRGDLLNFATGRFYVRQKFTQAHLYPAVVTDSEMDGINLPNMIINFKRLNSYKPADKVIGARSILEKLRVRPPPADYGLGLDRLYATATRSWALSRGQVNCLGLAATPKQPVEIGEGKQIWSKTLPSRVIDWKSGTYLDAEYVHRFLKVQEGRFQSRPQANASRGATSLIDVNSLSDSEYTSLRLTLKGVMLNDEVVSFKGPIPPSSSQSVNLAILEHEPDDLTFYRTLVQWMTSLCKATEIDTASWLEHLPPRVQSFAELMRRRHPVGRAWSEFVQKRHGLGAILKGIRLHVINSHQLGSQTNANNFDAIYKASLKNVPTSWTANTKLQLNEHRVLEELTRHLKELMVSECLFTTASGRVGMGFCRNLPVGTGDSIALVAGSDYPLVLRKTARPGEYQLIGTAFVGGLMDGEAWPKNGTDLSTLVLV